MDDWKNELHEGYWKTEEDFTEIEKKYSLSKGK